MPNALPKSEVESIVTYGSAVVNEMKLTQEQVHLIVSSLESGDISRHVADKITLTYLLLIRLRDKILSTRVYIDHSDSLTDAEYIGQWMHIPLPQLGGDTPATYLIRHGELGYQKIFMFA